MSTGNYHVRFKIKCPAQTLAVNNQNPHKTTPLLAYSLTLHGIQDGLNTSPPDFIKTLIFLPINLINVTIHHIDDSKTAQIE